MDDKSLEILEFHRVREILAGLASFPASRELAIGLQPLSDCEGISLLLRQSAEARHLLSLKPDFSLGEVGDIRQAVTMARSSNHRPSWKFEKPWLLSVRFAPTWKNCQREFHCSGVSPVVSFRCLNSRRLSPSACTQVAKCLIAPLVSWPPPGSDWCKCASRSWDVSKPS